MAFAGHKFADQLADLHCCYGVSYVFLTHVEVSTSLICCLMQFERPLQRPAFSSVLEIGDELLNASRPFYSHNREIQSTERIVIPLSIVLLEPVFEIRDEHFGIIAYFVDFLEDDGGDAGVRDAIGHVHSKQTTNANQMIIINEMENRLMIG